MSEENKTTEKTESVFSVNDLIGLAKDAAAKLAETAGYKHRIIEEDGVAAMTTMEINNKRVNFTISKGSVEKVKIG